MAALIVLGLVLVHVLGGTSPKIDKQQAVAIARPHIDFVPKDHQIRYIRRGVPPHGFWIVSFFIRKTAGGYKRVTVVVVDASNGRVTEVRRST
jgi:hypothetical protein